MTRDGKGAVSQLLNADYQQAQVASNFRNAYVDENMKRVEVTRVQQVNDRAFFQQGGRWVDSQAVAAAADANGADKKEIKPDRTVVIGTPEYAELLDKLVRDNRNGTLSLGGEILLQVDGKNVLVKGEQPDGANVGK